ncbi:hypothetical protein COY32_01485, partial [candidate division WWE3 bacterium CG_4_10_14_0_2_um_filter_41_14]
MKNITAKIKQSFQWFLYMFGLSSSVVSSRRGEARLARNDETLGTNTGRVMTRPYKIAGTSIVVIAVIALFAVLSNKSADATWFNDRWSYRIPVTVNYTGSVELTGFQVKVVMSALGVDALKSAGKLQSDCADLRFTSADGHVLPYWIEDISDTNDLESASCTNTNGAVWVKLDSIQTGGATIYAYYGNPVAQSESNGENTFEFFDGFGGSTVDTSKWSEDTSSFSVSSGILSHTGGAVQHNVRHTTGLASNANWRIITKSKVSDGNHDAYIGIGDSSTALRVSGNGVGARISGGTDVWEWAKWVSATETQLGIGGTNSAPADTYHRIEVTKAGTTFTYKLNGSQVDQDTVSEYNYTYFHVEAFDQAFYDYVVMTKYAATEPGTPSTGSEQAQSAVTGNAAPVAYWPLTKDTYNSGTSSLADLGGSADSGQPPVLHLTMDDGDIDSHSCPDGGAVAGACDVSGSGNHGTANGTMTDSDYVTGKIGPKALDFDGTDDYLAVADSDGLDASEAVTVSAWVNGTSWADADRKSVFIKGGAYYLTVSPSGNVAVYGYGKSSQGYHLSNATLSTGTWYSLALTIDPNGFKIYINGVLDKTIAATGLITTNTGVSAVGAEPGGTSRFFNGKIDEVKIYNYARTPEQIKADYNNTKAYFAGGN